MYYPLSLLQLSCSAYLSCRESTSASVFMAFPKCFKMELNKWAEIRFWTEFLFLFRRAGCDTESFTTLAMRNSFGAFWKIGEDDLLSVMMKAQGCVSFKARFIALRVSGLHYIWVGCRMSVVLSGEWNSWGCQWNHKHLWISFERCMNVASLTPTYLSVLSLKEASSFAVVCVYALLKLLLFLVPYQVLMLRGLKLYSFCDR